ncbi:P-loop containing nucleoside triphosphate hydrolase protein [Jimgerdemannia flammicorona]|uniref:P-loop containing nucleoside triphosphate hydrolase protein n=1 Tax=Jimgerdemannia flammicorona TaxID=994334 RepID=A0A433QGR8_9FUNG|nr:P-loop containing nucleoside triphosphate hydrolase protein [Jimgerdemannia flammicorona]
MLDIVHQYGDDGARIHSLLVHPRLLQAFQLAFAPNPHNTLPAIFAPSPRTMLIIGASGTGKSFVIDSLTDQFKIKAFRLSLGELAADFPARLDRGMHHYFALVTRSAPAILLLDNAELMFPKDGSEGMSLSHCFVECLEKYLSEDNRRVLVGNVIATSQRPQDIDSLIRKRFQVHFSLPLFYASSQPPVSFTTSHSPTHIRPQITGRNYLGHPNSHATPPHSPFNPRPRARASPAPFRRGQFARRLVAVSRLHRCRPRSAVPDVRGVLAATRGGRCEFRLVVIWLQEEIVFFCMRILISNLMLSTHLLNRHTRERGGLRVGLRPSPDRQHGQPDHSGEGVARAVVGCGWSRRGEGVLRHWFCTFSKRTKIHSHTYSSHLTGPVRFHSPNSRNPSSGSTSMRMPTAASGFGHPKVCSCTFFILFLFVVLSCPSSACGTGPMFPCLTTVSPLPLLRYGPPGTGKTLLAKAVATESSANFLAVSIPDLVKGEIGESEKAIVRTFNVARRCSPCVLFLDELEALFGRRETSGELGKKARSLLSSVTRILSGCFSFGSPYPITLSPHSFPPPSVPGRLDRHIYVPPPPYPDRLSILRVLARTMALSPDVPLDEVARWTEGYTGADLGALARKAGLLALRRRRSDGTEVSIEQGDFREALKTVKASVTGFQEARYRVFESSRF